MPNQRSRKYLRFEMIMRLHPGVRFHFCLCAYHATPCHKLLTEFTVKRIINDGRVSIVCQTCSVACVNASQSRAA